MADKNKLQNMLVAMTHALEKMHNSEDLNDAIAELQVHIDDEITANKVNTIVDNLFNTVRNQFNDAAEAIRDLSKTTVETEGELTPDSIDEIAELATAFYDSGNEFLMKQASVLDEILLTLAAPKNSVHNHKLAAEKEIENLRTKSREEHLDWAYNGVNKELDEQNKVAETGKAIADQVKTYRPLEAPLSTRSCPEHAGSQMARVGDNLFQCSLDGKLYNYEEGFKTMKGNQVPGGNVQNQTVDFGTREEGHVVFDTRDGRLSNS